MAHQLFSASQLNDFATKKFDLMVRLHAAAQSIAQAAHGRLVKTRTLSTAVLTRMAAIQHLDLHQLPGLLVALSHLVLCTFVATRHLNL